MHCETDELLATMLVKVVRQDGVNLEGKSQKSRREEYGPLTMPKRS
jgi:hypothetical protein